MFEKVLVNFESAIPSILVGIVILTGAWLQRRNYLRDGNKMGVGGLTVVIFGPIREELLFRLPVILLAGVFSTNIVVVLVSSVLFGLIHYKHSPLTNDKYLAQLEEKYPQLELGASFRMQVRILTVVFTGLFGVGLALLALRTGSLLFPMIIHMVWNIGVGPVILQLFILLTGIIYLKFRKGDY